MAADFDVADLDMGCKSGYHIETVPIKEYNVLRRMFYFPIPLERKRAYNRCFCLVPVKDSG